ncbi:hypothetical protein EVAR_66525_1 [Eumeta japonica]|uniref:Uncharacterized protein n=1 Tax=Eumeta variegata TaxID=151549 RepID=A0A4C1ZAN0_EUMVA|nr:hypothetical protein EVAR_66525_1 [Eumeta japonica]
MLSEPEPVSGLHWVGRTGRRLKWNRYRRWKNSVYVHAEKNVDYYIHLIYYLHQISITSQLRKLSRRRSRNTCGRVFHDENTDPLIYEDANNRMSQPGMPRIDRERKNRLIIETCDPELVDAEAHASQCEIGALSRPISAAAGARATKGGARVK